MFYSYLSETEGAYGIPMVVQQLMTASVLPDQLTERSGRDTPEKRLFWAILDDAYNNATSTSQSALWRKARTEAIEWFASEGSCWPCDFESVCEVLELNASSIRQAVKRAVKAAASGQRRPKVKRHHSRSANRMCG